LGEAPVWHEQKKACLWVDVESKIVYEYYWDEKTIKQYLFDQRVSLVVPASGDHLIVALQGGMAKFNTSSNELVRLPSPIDVDWNKYRFNDGGYDAAGRLWISTMELNHREGAGSVYCIEGNGRITKKISSISIPNGFVWAPDHRTLYYTDSIRSEVYAYSFDDSSGQIGFERVAIFIPENLGLPDGMAVDEEGMLWIALWGGYGVARFNPDTGQMVDFIDIPAPHVTCCCFVGDERDHMVITTAKSGMTEEGLRDFPESGNVFIVKMKVRGMHSNTVDL